VVVLRLGNAGALWLGVVPAGVGVGAPWFGVALAGVGVWVLWTPVAVVWELAAVGGASLTNVIAKLAMATAHRPGAIPAGLKFPRMMTG
jgi:hypothetical protein